MSPDRKTYGWGLVGPGRFARMFCDELQTVDRVRLRAVASRDLEKAHAFQQEYQFEVAYGSYAELFADPEIDIVYVVVPHAYHAEIARNAIEAGKAVFCEKPLTPSASASRELITLARDRGVFLMEGLKTGFLEAIEQAKQWIDQCSIGRPKILKADFCFRGSQDPTDRLLNPDLAGGAILDVGIYPLGLAHLLLGDIIEVRATGALSSTGVEESASIATRHAGGAVGALTCSINASDSLDATILGESGKIHLPDAHRATKAILLPDGKEPETFTSSNQSLVVREILAAMEALDKGLVECPGHPHAATLALAEAMDAALLQIKGHTY